MGGQALETSLKFDTFGFTAAELARKQAEREQKNRFHLLFKAHIMANEQ